MKEAETLLKTACIMEPGGNVLPTVNGDDYRYHQRPQVHHDTSTGERKMSGHVYALEDRQIRGFKVTDIKFVECPVEIQR